MVLAPHLRDSGSWTRSLPRRGRSRRGGLLRCDHVVAALGCIAAPEACPTSASRNTQGRLRPWPHLRDRAVRPSYWWWRSPALALSGTGSRAPGYRRRRAGRVPGRDYRAWGRRRPRNGITGRSCCRICTRSWDAAIISCQHACELVRSHGESGATARLLPFTVDGLIWSPPPAPGPVSSRPL